jgi:hypothetical protein
MAFIRRRFVQVGSIEMISLDPIKVRVLDRPATRTLMTIRITAVSALMIRQLDFALPDERASVALGTASISNHSNGGKRSAPPHHYQSGTGDAQARVKTGHESGEVGNASADLDNAAGGIV